MASTAKSSALAPGGGKISANICSISISSMNFSYEVVRPLSSQPAACSRKLQPPMSAPHRLICDSYADCASGALEAVAFEERQGRPMWRASWPAPIEDLTYSGVPKAGEPDFMSTLEVKLPYTTGAPGRTICDSTVPASASAGASVSAPATVTGAIAPARVNGVMMNTCPAAANSRMPLPIGMSSCSGELGLMMVDTWGGE